MTVVSLPAVGGPAPEFTLRDQFGQSVTLSTYRRHTAVVLVFFPLAFSSTCTSELGALRDNLSTFESAGADLLGISVDSTATLRAFADREGYTFSLLSDFWPHGEVAQRYGAFLSDKGFAARATVLVDIEGVVRASFSTAAGEARPLSAYRDVLDAL